jgi:hypothetical protein
MAVISGLKRTATKLGQIKASPASMGTNNGVYKPKVIKGADIPNWPSATWHTVVITSTDHDDAGNAATGGSGGLWLLAIKGDPAVAVNWQWWENISGNAEFAYLFTAVPSTPTTNPIFVDSVSGTQSETFDIINVGGTLTLTYHNSGNASYDGFTTQQTVRATSTDGINYTRQGVILAYDPRYDSGDGHTGYFSFGTNPFDSIPYTYIGDSIYGGGAEERNGSRMLWGSNDLVTWEPVKKYDLHGGRLSTAVTTGGDTYRIGLTMFHAAVREGAYWRLPVIARTVGFGGVLSLKHGLEVLIDENFNIVSEVNTYLGLGAASAFDESGTGDSTEFEHNGVLYCVYDASTAANVHSFGLAAITNNAHTWTLLNPRLSAASTIYDYNLDGAVSVPAGLTGVGGSLTLAGGRVDITVTGDAGSDGKIYTDTYITPSDYAIVDFYFDGLRTNSIATVTKSFGIYSDKVLNSNVAGLNIFQSVSSSHSSLKVRVLASSATIRDEATTSYVGYETSWTIDKEESPQAVQPIGIRLIPSLNIGYLLFANSEVATLDLTGYNFNTPVVMGMGIRNSSGTGAKTFGMQRIRAVGYDDSAIAVPAAPTMTVTAGNTEIAFSCPSVTGATGYKAFVGRNGVYNESDLGASNTGTVTGLTNDIEFTMFMRAYNDDGDSAPTATQTVTPTATPAATSTANITISGISNGDHYIYLNDASHNEIFRGLVTFAAEAATLPALPTSVGTRYFGYWPGTNAPTDGDGVTGVTV